MADLVKENYFDPQAAAAVMEAQRKVDQSGGDSKDIDFAGDALRKKAEKDLAAKAQQKKADVVNRESFAKDDGVQKRFQEVMDGRLGPEAQATALGWARNGDLQQKLTTAQKKMFQEAMNQDTPRATQAGAAMVRLSEQPGFAKAVPGSQQMGTLQQGLMSNPRLEKPMADLLQGRFMQSDKADSSTKNDFMRFGMQQMARGSTAPVKNAGDMLGTLAQTNTPRMAQRAAMNMVQRNPSNAEGMRNVDSFVQQPQVKQMPTMARGTATTLLAKADGKTEVKEGFERLASDPTFRSQSREVKGRFFSTIGSGRPSEYRAVTDKTLQALQSQQFPKREAQVSRFLNKMGSQVSRQGAAGVNVKSLMKSSKGGPLPPVPSLTSTEGLSDKDAQKVRSQNRAKVIQYFTQVSRSYDGIDRKLGGARYFEDVNVLPNLRESEEVDTTGLPPEDKAFINAKNKQLKGRYQGLKKAQQQRMRELRSTRISPQQQRMQKRKMRVAGQQPRYFNPQQARGGPRAAASFPAPGQATGLGEPNEMPQSPGLPRTLGGQSGLARTPQQQTRNSRGPGIRQAQSGGGGESLDAAEILASVSHLPPEQRMQRAKQLMANSWEKQMKAVMAGILDDEPPMAAAPNAKESADSAPPKQAKGSKGRAGTRTDGWGVSRPLDRDLGGAQHTAVKPPEAAEPAEATELTGEQLAGDKYTGRALKSPSTAVRDSGSLFSVDWKGMSRAETALLRNLGWTQKTWDTRNEPSARWPESMRTRFGKLTGAQRESVRNLGLTSDDWNSYVSTLGAA